MDMGSRHTSYNMVDENGEQLWRTADGQEIPFSKVTHQHWSNIYWYHRYIFETYTEQLKGLHPMFVEESEFTIKKCKYLMDFSFNEIGKRFDGEILDWIPKYENEKMWYKKQSTRKILIEKFKC